MIEKIKKPYNPFKMWGSWIGFFIAIILYLFLPFVMTVSLRFGPECKPFEKCAFEQALGNFEQKFSSGWAGDMNPTPKYLSTFVDSLVYGTIGFSIGWVIHSLKRKYNN